MGSLDNDDDIGNNIDTVKMICGILKSIIIEIDLCAIAGHIQGISMARPSGGQTKRLCSGMMKGKCVVRGGDRSTN